LRLESGLRFGNYAVVATLTATGVIWLMADMLKASEDGELWQAIGANMLMLHGLAAMIALVLVGAMIPMHLSGFWRARRNRISGAAMVGTNAALMITAWGLYYAGSDELRTFVADVHIAVGIALPALVATHVVLGRRSTRRADPQPASAERGRVEPLTGVVAGFVSPTRTPPPCPPPHTAEGAVAAE
jgi:cation transport ATPase